MAKLNLSDITSFTQSAVTTINSNNQKIEDVIEEVLSRDGTSPNQMQFDFDMNHNDILNAASISTDKLYLNGNEVIPVDLGVSGALLKQNNLSDLPSVPDARKNLAAQTYVSNRTQLKALDPTKDAVVMLREGGREGEFVWKNGNYSSVVSADTLEGIFIKADSTPATSGAWVRLLDDVISPRMFGAKGDAVTDDTAAVRLAWSFAQDLDKTLLIDGRFLVGATTGTEVFLWNAPCAVRGYGMFRGGSELIFKANTPSNIDWIRLAPDISVTGERLYGWNFSGVFLRPESGNPGRYGFFLQLRDNDVTSFFAKFLMIDNWIWNPGSSAFFSTKGGDTGSGTFDGFFTSFIGRNWFVSGPAAGAVMHLQNSGDSLTVEDNIFQGYGVGIRTSPVNGAAMQVFQKNNITARGGAIEVSGGQQVKFLYNQCELVVPMESGQAPLLDALVTINADSCEIIGNNLGAKNYGHCVRITSGSRNIISDNVMQADTVGGKYHVVFTGVDVGLLNEVRADNRFLNLTGSPTRAILDGGTTNAQIGVWKKLTLSNSWVDHSDVNFAQGLFFMVDENKRICLRGSIMNGTNTPGTTVATLPPGARPTGFAERFAVMLNSGAMGTMLVTAGGAIQIETALSSVLRVSFDDVVINSF